MYTLPINLQINNNKKMNPAIIGFILMQNGYMIKRKDIFGHLLYIQREKNWIMLKAQRIVINTKNPNY